MPSWSHTITLDGSDITDETTLSSVAVEEAERQSFLMDVEWRPAGGQQTGLALQSLTLSVNLGSGSTTLFSGYVVRATWQEKRQSYQLRASNRLQEHFRALGTEADVATELADASVYTNSDFLGEPPDDLWEYAEQLLETAPYDCHIDRTGTLQLVPWARGSTDHTLTASDVEDAGPVEWVEADADTKTNRVVLELGYSVQRHKLRSHLVTFTIFSDPEAVDLCNWLQSDFFTPPWHSLVMQVVDPGSWSVPDGIYSTTIPVGEEDICFAGMQPFNWDVDGDVWILTWSATGYQAFACEIQETYTITLNATGAQTLYGATVSERRTAACTVEADGAWPPEHVASDALTSPSTDTVGDDYVDQNDETRRADFLDTAYHWGRTKLLEGQRQDSRRVRTVLRPDITLDDTVRIDLPGLDCTGKVRRLRHTLAPLRTEITVAISRGGGSTDAYTTPSRPDSSDPVTYWETENAEDPEYEYPTPSTSHAVPVYVGSRPSSLETTEFAEDEEGWFTNAANYPGFDGNEDQIYDLVLRVHWPEREQEATAGMAFATSATFEIATPSDPLTIG